MSPRNLRDNGARRERFFENPRLLVIRPIATTAGARNHLDAAYRLRRRLDHKLKSGHKPISQSRSQIRQSRAHREGEIKTALTFELYRAGKIQPAITQTFEVDGINNRRYSGLPLNVPAGDSWVDVQWMAYNTTVHQ